MEKVSLLWFQEHYLFKSVVISVSALKYNIWLYFKTKTTQKNTNKNTKALFTHGRCPYMYIYWFYGLYTLIIWRLTNTSYIVLFYPGLRSSNHAKKNTCVCFFFFLTHTICTDAYLDMFVFYLFGNVDIMWKGLKIESLIQQTY